MNPFELSEEQFLKWIAQAILNAESSAEILRSMRKGMLDISQDEMARLMRVKYTSYTKWESGKTQPGARNLLIAFRVVHYRLFNEEEQLGMKGDGENE